MAITRIMASPPVPRDAPTYGHLSDTLSVSDVMTLGMLILIGVIWLSLCVWLCIQLFHASQQLKAVSPVGGQGTAVSFPPPFGSAAHANGIYQFTNGSLYQCLLAELEKALLIEGYVFTTDKALHAPLTKHSQQQVAFMVFMARERHMVPIQPEIVVAEKARLAARDGYSEQLLALLTEGNESLGWYITRRDNIADTGV